MSFATQFDEHFSKYRDKPIIVYGLGDNAKKIFYETFGYNLCAITAKDHFGETFFGREVLPIEEAVKRGEVLIIAAMPNPTNIIYARIKDKIPEGFPVFDIRGHCLNMSADYKDNPYWNKNVEGLKKEIATHDVISFDIFDTLMTRKTLYPRNVFDIVERKLRNGGRAISFSSLRMEAEKDLTENGNFPTLSEIYEEMGRKYSLEYCSLRELKCAELETEKRLLRPRQAMVDILSWAKSQGKTVILASDMYLESADLEPLLSTCGICGYDKLLISCEQKASKSKGTLYEKIKELYPGKAILHIGDNEADDIDNARRHGLDAYWIMNPLAMVCASSAAYIVDEVETLDDALLLGGILASALENPFALNPTKGKINISSVRMLTEVCLLPITMRYMQYIFQVARKQQRDETVILFASRDGWLLQKIYAGFAEQYDLPEGIYFYTSRQAATGAVTRDVSDIDVLCNDLEKVPVKNLKAILEQRFQVDFPVSFDMSVEEAMALWGSEGLKKRVYAFKETILQSSREKRKGYLHYLDKIKLKGKKNIYMVDIIAHGTAVYALSRMLEQDVHLISCFGADLPNDYIKDMELCNLAYGNIEYTSRLSGINPVLEIIYAPDEGQLAGFSENGEKVFVDNSRYKAEFLSKLQGELMDLLAGYADSDWPLGKLSNSFAAGMLDILHVTHSDISEEVVAGFDFYDPLDRKPHSNAIRRYRLPDE